MLLPLLHEPGIDPEVCYAAIHSRDARFDGQFVTAVRSTGIYCRPSCPALTPRRSNVSFTRTAAAAQRAGYRACKRCQPDAAPGSTHRNLVADTTGRALRLVEDGVVDRDGVDGLAARLGFSTRQLRRHLTQQLGAGPLALARAQRAKTARLLLESTDLTAADVAFAAGFGSVRQCNETLRQVYAATPREIRGHPAGPRESGPALTPIDLRLPGRIPADVHANLRFLGRHAIRGVEDFDGVTYARSMRLPHAPAVIELSARGAAVSARLHLGDLRDLAAAVARCRRLLDLDADPAAVDAQLASFPALRTLVARFPGRLLPGTHEGGETAIRAVLGQQISVTAARNAGEKLVRAVGSELPRAVGKVTHLFPAPGVIAELSPTDIPTPLFRAHAVLALARLLAGGLRLDPGVDREQTEKALLDIPGIGRWTARYVRMRALADPDVFLADDLVVRRSAAALGLPPDLNELRAVARSWAPWGSYVTGLLWAYALESTPLMKEAT